MSSFPDPGGLGRDELTSLLKQLTARESAVSSERKQLHAQIDALRLELVERLRDEGQTTIVSGAQIIDDGTSADEPAPSETSAGRGSTRATAPVEPGAPEARLEQTEDGLIPTSPGWFVLNAMEARWFEKPGQGHSLLLTALTIKKPRHFSRCSA